MSLLRLCMLNKGPVTGNHTWGIRVRLRESGLEVNHLGNQLLSQALGSDLGNQLFSQALGTHLWSQG